MIVMHILKKFVSEAVEEAKVRISDAYKRKEAVRAELQAIVAEKVRSGAIKDQADLDDYVSSMGLAMTALKMIPFDVWRKL